MENKIGENFDKIAHKYDEISDLQKEIADFLWNLMKKNEYKNICELGCGTGFLTKNIAKFYINSEIKCFDLSQKSINIAKSKIKSSNIEYICKDFDEIDNFDKFDFIFSSMSLQWSCDLIKVLQKINDSRARFGLAIPVCGSLNEMSKSMQKLTRIDSILNFPEKDKILNILQSSFLLKTFSKTMKMSEAIRLLSNYKTKNSNNSVANIKKMINNNDEVEFSYDVLFIWR